MWKSPPNSLELKPEEIHVWRSKLASSPIRESFFWSTLSTDEQKRANRYHFRQHRLEYIDARGKLRHLIGRYLNMAPKDIVFEYGEQEKPSIGFSNLKFNISHSHGLALFAFGLEMEIGVDLEKIRPDTDIPQLCEHFFSPNEAKTILQLSGDDQMQAFFSCWTRKEAFIKAKGQGLSLPLDQFEVAILPNDPVRLIATHWDPTEVEKWFLYSLSPGESFAGALMVNQKIDILETWEF